MAAVVKTKGKSRKPPSLEEKNEERTLNSKDSQSTSPRPTKHGEKGENIVIDMEKSAKESTDTPSKTNGMPY